MGVDAVVIEQEVTAAIAVEGSIILMSVTLVGEQRGVVVMGVVRRAVVLFHRFHGQRSCSRVIG
jgi:hypothetical protein